MERWGGALWVVIVWSLYYMGYGACIRDWNNFDCTCSVIMVIALR